MPPRKTCHRGRRHDLHLAEGSQPDHGMKGQQPAPEILIRETLGERSEPISRRNRPIGCASHPGPDRCGAARVELRPIPFGSPQTVSPDRPAVHPVVPAPPCTARARTGNSAPGMHRASHATLLGRGPRRSPRSGRPQLCGLVQTTAGDDRPRHRVREAETHRLARLLIRIPTTDATRGNQPVRHLRSRPRLIPLRG